MVFCTVCSLGGPVLRAQRHIDQLSHYLFITRIQLTTDVGVRVTTIHCKFDPHLSLGYVSLGIIDLAYKRRVVSTLSPRFPEIGAH